MNDWYSMQEFFSEIASAGFFKRLFSWKKIKAKADAAQSECKKLEARERELEEVKKKLAAKESVDEEWKADYQRKAETLTTLIQQKEERRQREVAIKKAEVEEYRERVDKYNVERRRKRLQEDPEYRERIYKYYNEYMKERYQDTQPNSAIIIIMSPVVWAILYFFHFCIRNITVFNKDVNDAGAQAECYNCHAFIERIN